jgi:NADPH:quinone reductase-like Zn-dependent oxidoreductase
MKAIVQPKYGSADELQIIEVEKPVARDDEALVKIHAASLNAADLETLRGTAMVRIAGPRRPMYRIPGSDIAGRVEAIGTDVEQFQPGDEVYTDLSGCGFGAFAEYVCVPEKQLVPKPGGMTFEEAAAYPQAAVVALQGLCEAPLGMGPEFKKPVQEGQMVLINGAGGGMGTFAVQIARYFGAEVTAVDSPQKLDMLRSIGADHVIDYTQEDYTRTGKRYDLVLDVAAHRSFSAYKRTLNPEGKFIMVGGSISSILQVLILGQLISRTSNKAMGINSWKLNNKDDLALLEELFNQGKVVPVIDRSFPLSDVPAAYRYLEEDPHLGKIIINMIDDSHN